jgi:RimK family alpha-L-glutamate ligase
MRFALVAHASTPTNDALAAAGGRGVAWERLAPEEAFDELRPGDVALGRLDVLRTLDGIEDGISVLGALAARGVVVLNGPGALLATHDKLLTSRVLRRSQLPHPEAQVALGDRPAVVLRAPAVVKPRFGSWGRSVTRCDSERSLRLTLEAVRGTRWYAAHGALVQDLVPPVGHDLRLVVAAGRVVGAVAREAAPGEWRTNVALGARRRRIVAVPPQAASLAVRAAAAAGAALVGVDLLPDGRGGWTVLELNGAVELTGAYSLGGDVFGEISFELARLALDRARAGGNGREELGTPVAAA